MPEPHRLAAMDAADGTKRPGDLIRLRIGSPGPLVSIVTPTFNRASLLELTLRSVRNQTYGNLEHIVVDGGSSDGTQDLLRRYEALYPITWSSGPDGGMYEAINKGMREARGEILAYLNSDDLYLPWAVEVVVEHFAKHPDADFVFGAALTVDDRTGRHSFNFQQPFDLDYVRRCGFLCQPTVFWRRRVVEEEGGFDESLRYVADCEYWMRVGDHRSFVKLNEFVAVERNHGATLREVQALPVFAELADVRARYVKLEGLRHRIALMRHSLVSQFWVRAHWAGFIVQSALPWRRSGPWSRLINSGEPAIRWHLLPLRLIPGLSARRPRVIRPGRHWLNPPGP